MDLSFGGRGGGHGRGIEVALIAHRVFLEGSIGGGNGFPVRGGTPLTVSGDISLDRLHGLRGTSIFSGALVDDVRRGRVIEIAVIRIGRDPRLQEVSLSTSVSSARLESGGLGYGFPSLEGILT